MTEDSRLQTPDFMICLLAAALILVPAFVSQVQAQPQGQASGGTIPDAGPASKPATKTSAKPARAGGRANVTKSSSSSNPTAAQSPATISGKWWTTGNGFGDSEVVFTQAGDQVAGLIRYADGRTGNVKGQMVGKKFRYAWQNSSGDGGTGWLELSWNNFLGGPWHSQRVRDGSWTLSRFEGKWCFGGSRDRIRTVKHNARGEVSLVTEDGWQDEGHLEGPFIILDGEFGSIKGTMSFRNSRIDWNTGFFWTWCGQ